MDSDRNNHVPFFTKFLSLQAEITSTCIFSLASPFISLVSDLFLRRPPSAEHYEPATEAATPGGLLGRIAVGLVAAVYACVVLTVVMAAAAILGVLLVSSWAEKPVYARAGLPFDYAEAHPTAVFDFGNKGAAGHTLYVSLLLLMPDSDYNRDLGMFQLTAELISLEGDLVAKSSHPCMLRFRSWPVRVARTFLMGAPLLLGITSETQVITFPILKHKETTYPPQTQYIRITMIPRAGTTFLPQFYNTEIVVKSRPPWTKEFVYKWKWTFCVWTTMYIFIMLVMVLLLFLKPLIFPVLSTPFPKYEHEPATVELLGSPEALAEPRDEREVSESVKRWQQSRSKRKAALLSSRSSAATSIFVTQRENASGAGFEEGSGDSAESCKNKLIVNYNTSLDLQYIDIQI